MASAESGESESSRPAAGSTCRRSRRGAETRSPNSANTISVLPGVPPPHQIRSDTAMLVNNFFMRPNHSPEKIKRFNRYRREKLSYTNEASRTRPACGSKLDYFHFSSSFTRGPRNGGNLYGGSAVHAAAGTRSSEGPGTPWTGEEH